MKSYTDVKIQIKQSTALFNEIICSLCREAFLGTGQVIKFFDRFDVLSKKDNLDRKNVELITYASMLS